ncbi:MAG: hypothetical protein MI975_21015 [Cytophagales bacterium]|nr:hypothetical protein [Cytophagales bacterium]
MRIGLTVILILIANLMLFAQTSRDNSKTGSHGIDRGATYKVKTSRSGKKQIKHSIRKDFDRKIEEYEERMEQNAKRNKQLAKKMKKPQYSDPTYFGQKKKKKKRPPGKKKFCKECEMYH